MSSIQSRCEILKNPKELTGIVAITYTIGWVVSVLKSVAQPSISQLQAVAAIRHRLS